MALFFLVDAIDNEASVVDYRCQPVCDQNQTVLQMG